jgi:hypothetical protein
MLYCKKNIQSLDFRKNYSTAPIAYRHFFSEKCFLSPLVVSSPCHPWLSPLLVALTGEREKEKIL